MLARHGSLVFELGDTYAGSGGAGGDYNAGGLRDGQAKFDGSNHRRGKIVDHTSGRRSPGPGWPLDKSLTGIPHLFAFSLAYGRNLLRPERTTESWRVRNVVAWCRPNPPVGALSDKFRPATSYLTIATKSRNRYFDLDAVRTPVQHPDKTATTGVQSAKSDRALNPYDASMSGGAPPLDWWEISTQPYKGSHYATWPEALLVRPILSMCPTRVCTICGEPSRRLVGEAEYVPDKAHRNGGRMFDAKRASDGVNQWQGTGENKGLVRAAPTVGWTDCGCSEGRVTGALGTVRLGHPWRNGCVLDPFAGSGTTLAVAQGHGRDAIGIDLDERNADLARERVGMFLRVDTREEAP